MESRRHTGGWRAAAVGLAVVAAAGLVGCSTGEDPDLVSDISTLSLVLVDSGIEAQSVSEPDGRHQAVTWTVGSGMATLTFPDSSPTVDFTFGQSCRYIDTIFAGGASVGICQDGIVVDSRAAPITATLNLTVGAIDVRRARPPAALGPGRDFDFDGFLNEVDICPLRPDFDQSDDNGDGIGDACSRIDPFDGSLTLDNDGDRIADASDNCVWIANIDQADTGDLAMEGILDGIGDVCDEQRVDLIGGTASPSSVTITRTVDIEPRRGQPAFVTVDFGDAITCDWGAGTCSLDPGGVEVCFGTNRFLATLGCF